MIQSFSYRPVSSDFILSLRSMLKRKTRIFCEKVLLPRLIHFLEVCAFIYLILFLFRVPASADSSLSFGSKLSQATLSPVFLSDAPTALKIASASSVDVARVCNAIAFSESTGCKNVRASGDGVNNCWGIMRWDSAGNRHLKSYASIEEGQKDCESVWGKGYGVLPDASVARKWTGNDKPDEWLNNFWIAYNRN